MPTDGRPKFTVRLDPETRDRFSAAAHEAGTDAASLVRAFIHWYLHDKGFTQIKRPRPRRPD